MRGDTLKTLLIPMLFIVASLIVSCSVGLGQSQSSSSAPTITVGGTGQQSGQSTQSTTPYASLAELEAVTNISTNYVYWRVARFFALVGLENFREETNWKSASLSAKPVIIYDGASKPEYYEYRVCVNGSEVGEIACAARKDLGKPVQHIWMVTNDYSAVATKGANYRLIDAGYPNKVFYGILSKDGDAPSVVVDPVTGLSTNAVLAPSAIEFLTNADINTLSNIGITTDQYQATLASLLAQQSSNSEMWAQIDQNTSNVINISDAELSNAAALGSTKSDYVLKVTLQKWSNASYYWNCSGYCAPYCLTYLSTGWGIYPGYGRNMEGDAAAIQTVYNYYNNFMGVNLPVTSYQMAVAYGLLSKHGLNPISIGVGYPNASISMAAFGAPVVMLRSCGVVNGSWDWSFHYKSVIGLKQVHTEWLTSILFVNITCSSDDFYYAVHDNGADGYGNGYGYEEVGNLDEIAMYATW
jgi:hypothetical protein